MYTNGSELTNLTNNTAYDSFPAWSPDGTRLAFISDRLGRPEVFAMNADGSNLVQLTDVRDTASWWDPLAWSPDGQWLVASRIPNEMTWVDKGQVNLYLINADGSGATQITTNEVGNDLNPHWSPDGKFIVFARSDYGQIGIYSIHSYGSNLTALALNVGNEGIFDWAPDGQLYYLSTDTPCLVNGCVLVDELRTVNGDGTNQRSLLTLKLRDPSCTSGNLISSPDGTRMLIRFPIGCTSEGQLFIVNSDGINFRELLKLKNLNLSPGEWISQVNWSPDGKFIVFVAGKDPNQDIYILDIDKALQDPSTLPIRLTDNTIMDNSAVWQPKP
jgi:Tol biopolymer transport system component